jgi:hypothetical protein
MAREDEALADDGTGGVIVFLGHGNETFAVPKTLASSGDF